MALLVAGAPARAADAPSADRLEALNRDLARARADDVALRKQAAGQALELKALKRRLVALAAKTRRLDQQVAMQEEELARLKAEEAETVRALAARRQELVRLLGALERLAREPPAAMVASVHAPLETIRGGLLMRAAVPALEGEARRLAGDLRRLASLNERIAAERQARDESAEALIVERRALLGLIAEKSGVQQRLNRASQAAEARAGQLAAEAHSIEQLVERVARAERQAALRPEDLATPPVAAPAAAPGRLEPAGFALPAAGRIAHRFGEPLAGGGEAQGLTVATRPSAEVLAPRTGEVVFAGPFRGYGRLLIIRHGDGYHVLLAGLERLDADVGDQVLAGEPIGAMGADRGEATRLYIELRHSGRPINPLPWLAANRHKVSG